MLLLSNVAFGQKTWIETTDGSDFAPDKEVKIYVDIKNCDCQRLLGATEVFLWTWNPAGDEDRSADNKNGEWTASNPTMAFTSEGNDVWSFTMIPTDFYNVDADVVYENDFSFLVKASDGSGLGGGGCDEDKTEDLQILVEAPVTILPKVYSFPFTVIGDTLYTSDQDVFTLIYNNAEEEKTTMQNLDEAWVYARGMGTDGNTYKVESLNNIGNNPALKMTKVGTARFQLSIIPRRFFPDLPQGVGIESIRFQILKWAPPGISLDEIIDGEFMYHFNCN